MKRLVPVLALLVALVVIAAPSSVAAKEPKVHFWLTVLHTTTASRSS
jgi:hypothetical protein